MKSRCIIFILTWTLYAGICVSGEGQVLTSGTSAAPNLNRRIRCVQAIARDISAMRSDFVELSRFIPPKNLQMADLRYRYKVVGTPTMRMQSDTSAAHPYEVKPGGCEFAVSIYGPDEVAWQGTVSGPNISGNMVKTPGGTEIDFYVFTRNEKLRQRFVKIIAARVKSSLGLQMFVQKDR